MVAHEFKSAIVQNDRLLPGIHGLRGLAALAVALYHLNHLAGVAPPDYCKFIGRDFGFSVHLFYIVSAFSLTYSTGPRTGHPNWIPEYFIKRFFRIAPLFYLITAFEIVRQAAAGKIITDFKTILLNVTFTFGFVPFSGMVWGGMVGGRRNDVLRNFPRAYPDNPDAQVRPGVPSRKRDNKLFHAIGATHTALNVGSAS
jgi:hypothetical protein